MSKYKVYLAGAMTGLSFEEMNAWRLEAANMFKQYSKEILTINPVDFYNFKLDPSTYTDKEVKEFDLHMVKNCDLILVNLNYPDSIGTAIELECASRFWDKPIIAFGGDNVSIHPWIELTITKKCKKMKDAIEYIIDFYFVNR